MSKTTKSLVIRAQDDTKATRGVVDIGVDEPITPSRALLGKEHVKHACDILVNALFHNRLDSVHVWSAVD